MRTETIPFDAAQHLTDKAAQRQLLSEAMASGDASVIAATLGLIARAQGMTRVAKVAGITREALYRSLSSGGDPRLSTLVGVTKALGLRLTTEEVAPVDARV